MQVRLITIAAVVASLVTTFAMRDAQAYDYTAPVPFHTVANFDPALGVVPFPNNLLLTGSTDLTLNIPVANPNNFADPQVALNALDGFSTSAPWSMTFSQPIDPTTLVGGQTVRMFEVSLSGPGGGVTGIQRELASPQEFVVASAPSDATGRTLAIVPTSPLKQMTSYMAVVTNGINTAAGAPVRSSLAYLLAERTHPLCSGGQSTIPALPAASACALEPLRQLVNSQEAAASAAGVAAGSIVMSWVATTQSITPTLQAIESVIQQSPAPVTHIAPTGETLANLGVGLPPVADIYIGTIDLPYYLSAPAAASGTTPADCSVSQAGATPCPPLTGFWHAAPLTVPGLDPTSTNVTYLNPLPVATSTETVPLLLTVPNAASGKTKPANGWPVVIFQHGITRNRTDMFAIAGTLAAQGFAVVAIDLPLHGLTDTTNPFYIGNTPFAAIGARERTFDIDLQNNTTGAPGPDGVIDPSGSYFINLTGLLTSRDNLRQGEADLLELSRAAPSLLGAGGIDANNVSFVGQSLGSIVGTVFLAIDPTVKVGVINVPGGGIARLLDASPAFGPRIHAGLAAAGLTQGTPAYDAYFVATQTVIDSGDPINFPVNSPLLATKSLLLQEVVGGGSVLPDQVIPNSVAGAPLSGTEPLIAALGLSAITGTTRSATGIRGAVRFLLGDHGSLLDPTGFPAATMEMQGEMASMLVTGGYAVQVSNPAIIRGPNTRPASFTDKQWLGKQLFFDTNLSEPAGMACAACHASQVGWTGPDELTNRGGAVYEGAVTGRFGNRKPPSSAYGGDSPVLHFDATNGWMGGMFWDGRATGLTLGDPLAEQAMGPFLNPLEQNNASAGVVVDKVRQSTYANLFLAVWGTNAFDDTVTAYQMIGRSIADYERSAEVSPFNSRFDTSIGTGNGLTAQQTLGLSLFNGKAKCASCHTSTADPASGKVLFTDFTYINLGVPKNPMNPFYSELAFNPLGASWIDLGLGGYLKSAGYAASVYEPEFGKVKVPTLRNVDTRPNAGFVKAYGHNGYFKSLEDIVHFYNTRDVPGAGWPAPEYAANMTSEVGNLGLTPAEEQAIVAFLKTLNDTNSP